MQEEDKKDYQPERKIFTCILCEDIFSKPVTLTCGHTFCHYCILHHQMSHAQPEQEKDKAAGLVPVCPECRQIIWRLLWSKVDPSTNWKKMLSSQIWSANSVFSDKNHTPYKIKTHPSISSITSTSSASRPTSFPCPTALPTSSSAPPSWTKSSSNNRKTTP